MQLGELAKQIDVLSTSAEVVAISADPPDQAIQTSILIGGQVRLLYDSDLAVIKSFEMLAPDYDMAYMGYVIVDDEGIVVERSVDPLFGDNVPKMLETLRNS